MKKIISLILILSMLFSLFAISYGKDYEESIYKDDIEEIKAIGILSGDEKGNFNPTECMTRAEFAKVIYGILNINADTTGMKTMTFYDLPKDHWANGYISFAVSEGYMIGMGDNTFHPDDAVKAIDVVKTLINILGYKFKADLKGGYPMGYNIVAKELSIYKGIKLDINEYILREELAKILNNALDVPLVINKKVGDSFEYEIDPLKTLLTENLNIKRIKGKFTATDSASVLNYDLADDNYIKINDVMIKINDTEVNDYLGYNVSAIYKFDKDDERSNELLYIRNDKTETVTVNKEDIIDFNNNELIYEENDKQEKIKVSQTADYILNGDNVSYYKNIYKDIKLGDVTFIKDKNSSMYNAVIIKSYKVIVADLTDIKNKIVIDKLSSNKVDFNNKDILYNITLNGEKASFNDVKQNDIITYAMGKTNADIKITRDSIKGKVTEVNSDNEITIENKTYKENYYFISNNLKVTPDMNVTLYKDAFSNIAYYEMNKDEGKVIAFLVDMKERKIAGEKTLLAKFFTVKGEMSAYEFAKNAVINDEVLKNPNYTDVYNTVVTDGKIEGIYSLKLVEGKIKEMIKARTDKELKDNNDDGLCYMYSLKERVYNSEPKSYDFEIYVDSKVPFMVIPKDAKNAPNEDFKIKDYTSFSTAYAKYTVEAYTESVNDIMPCLVVARDSATTNFEGHDSTGVVSKALQAVDEEGNNIYKFTVNKGRYGGGTEKDLVAYEEDDLTDSKYGIKDIKVGDVLKLMYDGNGRITKFKVLAKTSEGYIGDDDISDNNKIYNRNVIEVKDGFVSLSKLRPKESDPKEYYRLKDIEIMILENKDGKAKVMKGSIADIMPNDRIMIQIISRMPQIIYIFRGM